MTLVWFMAFCLATAHAKTQNEQKCLQNCLAFTDQLKRAGPDVLPAEEAKKLCINSGISSDSDECKKIVSYSRELQVLLKAGVPKRHACRKSCKTNVKGTAINFPRSEKSCKICKLVVQYVSLGIKMFKKTEGEIIDSVNHLCESLSSKKVQQCKKIVGYVDEIFKLVLKGLAPGDICIKLKFCDGILKPSLLPAFALESKTLMKTKENRPCQLCQVLRDTIYDSSSDAMSTAEGIEKAFKIICGARKQPMEKSASVQFPQCKDVIAMSKLMVIYLNAGVAKQRVCNTICIESTTKKAVRSENSCKICKQVVNYVSMGIKIFNQTEKEIIDSVNQFCTTFSRNQKQDGECQKIVGYVDMVFKMVLKGMDVSQICVQLDFCNQMESVLPFETRLTGLLKSFGNRISSYARKAAGIATKKALRSEKSCKICKQVVNYVSMGIKIFKQTEKEIIDSVNQFCTTFSRNEKQDEECQKIVGYVDMVFKMVLKGMDVSQICVQLDFCNQMESVLPFETRLTALLKSFGNRMSSYARKAARTATKKAGRSEKSCKICKQVVNYVSMGIKTFNQTEKEIIDSVNQFCTTFSRNQKQDGECQKIVGYVDMVFKMVLKGMDVSQICVQLDFCNQMESVLPFETRLTGLLKSFGNRMSSYARKAAGIATKKAVRSEKSCKICKQVVNYVSMGIKIFNPTEKEIIDSVNQFCTTFSRNEKQDEECQKIVGYVDMVFKMVLKGMDVSQICVQLDFCNQMESVLPFETRLTALLKSFGNRMSSYARKAARTATKKAGRSEKSCKICKQVVNYVSMGIKTFNQTEKEIIDSVNQFCTTFSRNQKQDGECQKIVGYVDMVFKMVLKGMDVSQICVQLGFCKQMKSVLPFESRRTGNLMSYYARKAAEVYQDLPTVIERYHKVESGKEVTSSSNDKACDLCKTVTNIVYYSVKYANSTIEAIEEAIKVICNAQVGPVKKSCLFYLSKIDEIIQYIEKGLMPNDICVKLGFCSKTVHETNNLSWQNVHEEYQTTARSVCRICHSTERIVKKDMRTFESSLRLMTKYAQIACISPLNENLKEKCSYAAQVIQSAEQLRKQILDPSECKKVICNKPFIIAMHIAKKTNNQVCDICRYAENMLVKRFQNLDKTMQMSLSEVDKICDMIPYSSLSSRCHSYVNRTKAVCDNIVEKLKSANLCVKLRLCPKQIEDEKEGGKFFQHFFKGDGKNPMCNICISSVKAAQAKMGRRRNAQKFAMPCARLERISGKKICSEFNINAMIGRINWGESPEKVCKRMRLCDDKSSVVDIFAGIAGEMMKMFG
ncbi:uncharacterized protein LOC135696381 isoform X2 [Rhopilema esculentum]|uniref:uncharacterized protein LOC135696381 isoform X2 n=1 Tax=Rhopilema esculentum TaxID=499914 RepID=UPI0031CE951A